MNPKVDLGEFISGFLGEADDLLALASSNLLAAEEAAKRGSTSPRAVREAFRALHTIKGLASMVGVEPVVAIAHRMEAALRAADRGDTRLTLETIDLLLQGLRGIEQCVRAVREGKGATEPPAALLARLDTIDAEPAGARVAAQVSLDLEPALLAKLAAMERDQLQQGITAGKRALRADFTPSPARAAANVNITTLRERLKAHADIVKVLPISVPVTAEAPGGLAFVLLLLTSKSVQELEALFPGAGLAVRLLATEVPPPLDFGDDEEVTRSGLVRVEVSRLDDAMERLSALIVTRYRLSRAVSALAAKGADVRQLSQIMAENARQLRDLRAAVLHVRMVRVSEVLERVPLLVRGLRRSTGKLVRLEMDAGRAEVDKAVADRVFPAVVHLVRNAVDHAIESPEERRRLGKSEEGLLRIVCAERSNNQLEISIQDDGRGVDRERVASRAGREPPQSDAALLDLLCLPGLSTRDEATTTSGRGMGMDIVRRTAVEELGGELLLQTRPGQGSVFTLRIPLTITIVDAFTFECSGQRFVVPVSLVEEILEIDPAAVFRGPGMRASAASASMIQRRGEPLPLLQLGEIFGLTAPRPATRALVVRRAGEATGIVVDRLLGQQEVVIRPVDDPLVHVSGISGATDLGDGTPTLVLDLGLLAGAALGKEAAA